MVLEVRCGHSLVGAIDLQKLSGHQQCIDHCVKALEIDGTNTKAMFRQATAQMELGQLAKAREGFQMVKQLDPTLKVLVCLQLMIYLGHCLSTVYLVRKSIRSRVRLQ